MLKLKKLNFTTVATRGTVSVPDKLLCFEITWRGNSKCTRQHSWIQSVGQGVNDGWSYRASHRGNPRSKCGSIWRCFLARSLYEAMWIRNMISIYAWLAQVARWAMWNRDWSNPSGCHGDWRHAWSAVRRDHAALLFYAPLDSTQQMTMSVFSFNDSFTIVAMSNSRYSSCCSGKFSLISSFVLVWPAKSLAQINLIYLCLIQLSFACKQACENIKKY